MSETVIRVEQLGKRYRIGGQKNSMALRDVLARSLSMPARLFGRNGASSGNGHPRHFWALDDVSFNVAQGEVIGIVGRNGSGKSTLLKILARVTKPTRGHAKVRGRMGTLLEVGTGFHSELSGRENVFLSGAILGMRKAEIERKFDEIVAFADIDKFIDTALKHYSSGMQMRLAFAVAAHLDTEILLIDEVLAVGDASFQKKCLGKMDDVARQGKTILFVSHNLAVVETLCTSAVLISAGRVVERGPTQSVLSAYATSTDLITGSVDLTQPSVGRHGDGAILFVAARLLDECGVEIAAVMEGRPFQLELAVTVRTRSELSILSVTLVDQYSNDLWTTMHYDSLDMKFLDPGNYRFAVQFDPNFLASGNFEVRLACFGPHFYEYDHIHHAFVIAVAPSDERVEAFVRRPGTVNLPVRWIARNAEL